MAEGVRIYDAVKRGHDRLEKVYERLVDAGPGVESRTLNEIIREVEEFKTTEKAPRALLTEFQSFLASAGPLLATTEADESQLEEIHQNLENLVREAPSAGDVSTDEGVFDRVFELLDESRRSGEVTDERHEALRSALEEFRALTRESPQTAEAMASRVTRMRELINRNKSIFLGVG